MAERICQPAGVPQKSDVSKSRFVEAFKNSSTCFQSILVNGWIESPVHRRRRSGFDCGSRRTRCWMWRWETHETSGSRRERSLWRFHQHKWSLQSICSITRIWNTWEWAFDPLYSGRVKLHRGVCLLFMRMFVIPHIMSLFEENVW